MDKGLDLGDVAANIHACKAIATQFQMSICKPVRGFPSVCILSLMQSPTDDVAEATRAWIKAAIRDKPVDIATVAKRSKIAPSTLGRFLAGETKLPQRSTLLHLIDSLGVAPPASLRDHLQGHSLGEREQAMNMGHVDSRGIPVWGVHPLSGGRPEFRINPIALASLRRPNLPSLSQRTIAFYAPDETMAPRWEVGEPVIVDLLRPGAQAGTCALIKMTPKDDPNSDEVYLFRRYDGRGNGLVRLSRLDGGSSDDVPIDRVLEIRRVLDWRDVLA